MRESFLKSIFGKNYNQNYALEGVRPLDQLLVWNKKRMEIIRLKVSIDLKCLELID